ncbi:hypothetical protein ACWDUD_27880 [Rhodococcus sp. NPDC003382]
MRAFSGLCSGPGRAVAVKVDPEMLATLATTLMNHADEVRRAGNSHRTGPWYDLEQLPHSLEGSQLAAVSAEAVAVLAGAFDVLAGPIDQMAYIAGGGAQGYVIAEDEFASLIRNAGEVA